MKLTNIELFQYKLPFKMPVPVDGHTLAERDGFLLKLNSDQKIFSYGEIAPLPYRSKESLEDAKQQLLAIQKALTNAEIPDKISNLAKKPFKDWMSDLKLCPSVQFGMESAVLNLIARQRSCPLASLIHDGDYDERFPVNALINGTEDEVIKQAQEAVEKGYRCLKLKVGHNDVQTDIAKVRKISELTGQKALLRCDANRAWSAEEAIEFGRGVGPASLEYIEEPCKDPFKSPAFYDETMIPVALDESIGEIQLEEIPKLEGVDVIVLKPSIYGGLEKTVSMAKDARNIGLRVIISSAYESSIGIHTLSHMAAGYSRQVAMGLDTSSRFHSDLTSFPTIQKGQMNITSNLDHFEDINTKLLVPLQP